MSKTLNNLTELAKGKSPNDVPKLPLLKLGSKGVEVEHAQRLLASQGFYSGRVDGDYGRITDGAVRYFQSTHIGSDGEPLEVDGATGNETWWALINPSGAKQDQNLAISGTNRGLSEQRQAILRWAINEYKKNVREIPDGSNWGPRVSDYLGHIGLGPNPWCLAFIQSGFIEVTGKPFIMKTGHVWTLWNKATSIKMAFKGRSPVPGDIFVQLHSNNTGHIGFVYRVSDDGKKVSTIEGNTGNAVRLMERSVSSIHGFVVPYGDATTEYKFTRGLATGGDRAKHSDR